MSDPNEKRSVPLTIWMTETDSVDLERLRQKTAGPKVGGLQLPLVRPAPFAREIFVLGLRAFEQSLGKSESFPAHSPPAGKIPRRARKSAPASNVIKLKQSA